jgi:hypothetical protein
MKPQSSTHPILIITLFPVCWWLNIIIFLASNMLILKIFLYCCIIFILYFQGYLWRVFILLYISKGICEEYLFYCEVIVLFSFVCLFHCSKSIHVLFTYFYFRTVQRLFYFCYLFILSKSKRLFISFKSERLFISFKVNTEAVFFISRV